MTGRRRLHAIAERRSEGGFHVNRWLICRCGWSTPKHYSASLVAEWFAEHQAEREAAGEW